MPRQATWCSPDSAEFREVFKDNSIHKMKVIFWALISSSPLISKYHLAHSVLSALFISKINTSFFFWSDRDTLFVVVCPESSASSECERFEGTDKRHFSNQHFFFLKRFFLFKSCFSLFISVLKVLPSWFLSRGLIWGRWSLQNWLDKLGNYNVEHAVLWNVL